MKEDLKDVINNIYLTYKRKILNISNGIIEKNEILNNFILLNKKKVFLKDISDCVEEGKKYIFFIKNKKLIPSFYKRISLFFFYKVKRNKNSIIVSIDQRKFNNLEKKKMNIEMLEAFKRKCNNLVKEYKKKMPLKKNKENEKKIKELRNFSKEKFLFLKGIIM
ncbi:hypothetical protein VFPYRVIR_100 [Candidatus Vidania fulgoroideae]|nr:hypothetical protein VFPYRVIR_100 [Candidatus Vidania fulgoroideae]